MSYRCKFQERVGDWERKSNTSKHNVNKTFKLYLVHEPFLSESQQRDSGWFQVWCPFKLPAYKTINILQSEKAWKIGTITLFKQRQYLVSFCSDGDSVGSSFLSNDGRLIGEQISFRLQVFYQFQAKNYNAVTNLTQWYIIHSSPITLTAKRSPLNSTDRSALALSSREILCTLTWNEHGNVHRGSFCSSVARKKKKEATSTTDRRSKNTEGAIWLILCLINIHSLSWRGEEVTLHFRHSTDAFTQSSSEYSKALTQCDSAEIQGVS